MELITQSLWMYALAIFISLIVAGVIRGIVLALSIHGEKTAKKMEAAAPAPKPVAAPVQQTGNQDIAAIAAAIYEMIGAHRIVHIQDGRTTGSWTLEGRWMHRSSHDTRPKR